MVADREGYAAAVLVTAPDLRVTDIAYLPDPPADGEQIAFTATVVNDGADAVASFAVRFEIDGV